MGPTKAIAKDQALYEAATGKVIKDGFASRRDIEEYVNHHYLALPVVDHAGNAWLLDGKPVYCFRGSQYETLDGQRVHLARCPGAWASAQMNSRSNPTASAACPVNMSSMRGWR